MRKVSIALLVLWVAALPAQSTFGTIVGRVTDASGQAISGAAVELSLAAENYTRRVTSARDGLFEAANLPPGRYDIQITYQGFQKFRAEGAVLGARQTVRV